MAIGLWWMLLGAVLVMSGYALAYYQPGRVWAQRRRTRREEQRQ